MHYTKEEIKNIITLSKYEFYKQYVEPLEKQYDELENKYNKLEKKFDEIKKKKQVEKQINEVKKGVDYRQIASSLNNKIKDKDKFIFKLKVENDQLKKEIDVYKGKLMKGEKRR